VILDIHQHPCSLFFLRNYYDVIGFVFFCANFWKSIILNTPVAMAAGTGAEGITGSVLMSMKNNNNNAHPYCERVRASTYPLPDHHYRSMMIHP